VIFLFIVLGEINVYFNKYVDTTYKDTFPSANGNIRLDSMLIQRINQSKYSIDFCFYNMRLHDISNSLILAYKRGVKIRVIVEHNNWHTSCIQRLLDNDIPVIDDSTLNSPNNSSLMHNKFAIFDARDTIWSNDWIWTGSYNITNYGTTINSNDVIEIQDSPLAQAFTNEFNEMWGDTKDISPDTGHFGVRKRDNPFWCFSYYFDKYTLLFSPGIQDSVKKSLIALINTADHSIYFCIYCFSDQDICDAMKKRREKVGVIVRGIFDANFWIDWEYSKARDMIGDIRAPNPWIPPAEIYVDSVENDGLLHNKYLIIDAEYPNSNPIVITGSQNWSKNGFNRNDENILAIYSPFVANQYLQHFIARYTEAGGRYVHPDSINNKKRVSYTLLCYPNPFKTSTNFRVSGEGVLWIYDLGGRAIRSFPINNDYIIWDGKDELRRDVRSGIYFINLKSITKKIIKL
jgi:phosphatidylserine/phosphatidylglycerophosphate/cardiolipin synthase-like enzyme